MNIKIALQTITWGDDQAGFMDRVIAQACAAGYEGLEIGWRRIAPVGIDRLRGLLNEHGMTLVASHAGGNLVDLAQAGSERQQVDEILHGVVALGGKFLMYSGLKYVDDRQLAADVRMLNTTAQRCRQRGVCLLYHGFLAGLL